MILFEQDESPLETIVATLGLLAFCIGAPALVVFAGWLVGH